MTTIDPTPELIAHIQRHYHERLDRIVKHLHDAADRFAREAQPYDTPSLQGGVPLGRNAVGVRLTGCPRYTAAAEHALHVLTWDLANAGPHQLVTAAGFADDVERKAANTLPAPPAEPTGDTS